MSENTKISWAHHTHNLWWGCEEVSPACDNCYARVFSHRLGFDVWGLDKPRRFFEDPHYLKPLKWNAHAAAAGERQQVFCASMMDIAELHPDPDAAMRMAMRRDQLFRDIVPATPWLDWLFLTKRPSNYRQVLPVDWVKHGCPRNVWLGTTAEDQAWFDVRAKPLLAVDAVVHFISHGPALGAIKYGEHLAPTKINWVVTEGESSQKSRAPHPDWFRADRDQCIAAGVPWHFKQWGERGPAYSHDVLHPSGVPYGSSDDPDGRTCQALPGGRVTGIDWDGGPGPHLTDAVPMIWVGVKRAGRTLDGREWLEFPTVAA